MAWGGCEWGLRAGVVVGAWDPGAASDGRAAAEIGSRRWSLCPVDGRAAEQQEEPSPSENYFAVLPPCAIEDYGICP